MDSLLHYYVLQGLAMPLCPIEFEIPKVRKTFPLIPANCGTNAPHRIVEFRRHSCRFQRDDNERTKSQVVPALGFVVNTRKAKYVLWCPFRDNGNGVGTLPFQREQGLFTWCCPVSVHKERVK